MTFGKGKTKRLAKAALMVSLSLAEAGLNLAFAQATSVAPLTTDQIVHQMVVRNEQRARALAGYQGTRVYRLEYHGLSDMTAELVVSMVYRRPGEKKFCVTSESGSSLLRNRVLKRLLEAEVEAMQAEQQRQREMGPENYEFQLVGTERISGQEFYVLEATPRTKNKFLFRGRIWVDGQDFAVVRMEGEPAKNPSWWTKQNVIRVTYQKIGEFWLPARNDTNTKVRIIGRSLLTIVYQDYEILNGAAQLIPASGNMLPCLGEPTKLTDARP